MLCKDVALLPFGCQNLALGASPHNCYSLILTRTWPKLKLWCLISNDIMHVLASIMLQTDMYGWTNVDTQQ